jgi:succinate dehydrogenase / fumarate reductase cytochrome b subunit
MLAFMGMRFSGIALVVYLLLHLYLLKQLADGPSAWDAFVALAKTPAFMLLDVVLIAGILGHGLNGLRLAAIGFGFQISLQRVLLMLVAAVAAVFTVIAAVVILFGMV